MTAASEILAVLRETMIREIRVLPVFRTVISGGTKEEMGAVILGLDALIECLRGIGDAYYGKRLSHGDMFRLLVSL